jgi:asparagine synthase (glutamine-hydrolysing)
VVDQWFHSSLNGALREALVDESSLMFGLLNPKPVRRLLEGHQSGRQDNHKLLFSLVMVEQWLRRTEADQEQCAQMVIESDATSRLKE